MASRTPPCLAEVPQWLLDPPLPCLLLGAPGCAHCPLPERPSHGKADLHVLKASRAALRYSKAGSWTQATLFFSEISGLQLLMPFFLRGRREIMQLHGTWEGKWL